MSFFKDPAFQQVAGIGLGLAAPHLLPALGSFVGGMFGKGAAAAGGAGANVASQVANPGAISGLTGAAADEAVLAATTNPGAVTNFSGALPEAPGFFDSKPGKLLEAVGQQQLVGMMPPQQQPVAAPPASVPNNAAPMPTMGVFGSGDPANPYGRYERGPRSLFSY